MNDSNHENMICESIHYVYVLVDQDYDRIKIGVSMDPIARARILGKNFNLSMSVRAGFSKAAAYRVERYLHKLHHEFKIPTQEIGRTDGYTEWFHFGCFALSRDILRNLPALVPMHRIRPEPPRNRNFVDECRRLLSDLSFTSRLREASDRKFKPHLVC